MIKRLLSGVWRQGWVGASFALLALTLSACTLSLGNDEGTPVASAITGAPVVSFSAPLPNATYLSGVSVNILARVSNAGEDIARVEISADGAQIATLTNPNPTGAVIFSITQTWTPPTDGQHRLRVVAFRADNSASTPAEVVINVLDSLPVSATETPTPEPATATPQADTAPTTAPTATNTPAPTSAQAQSPTQVQPTANVQPTSSAPTVRALGFTNVRRGPSTNFVPPVGAMNTDDTAPILALNTAGDWLKIRWGTSGEAWVFRNIVEVNGDLTSLPRESGPPVPTLPPATAAPATALPTTAPGGGTQPTAPPPSGGSGVDLTVGGWAIYTSEGDHNRLFINEPALAQAWIINRGNQASGGFFVIAQITNLDTGQVQGDPVAVAVQGLAPGEERRIDINFTDPQSAGARKRIVIIVDPNNQVPETNNDNNTSTPLEYVLGAR